MLTAQHWQDDLRYLIDRLVAVHFSPSFSPISWKSAATILSENIPILEEHQIIVKMGGLLARCSNGQLHFGLPYNPTIAFQRFPITLEAFPNGIFVTSATPLYQDLICTQLVQIGGYPIDLTIERVASFCACRRLLAVDDDILSHLIIPEVLHTLGIIDSLAKADFVVDSQQSHQHAIEIETIPFDHDFSVKIGSTFERNPVAIHHPPLDFSFSLPNSEIGVMKSRQEFPNIATLQTRTLALRLDSPTKHDFE